MAITTAAPTGSGGGPVRPQCKHTRGHISDSHFYGNSYATPESRAVFCDVCRAQRWLDVEVALAQAEAELGMIPHAAAAYIAAAADVDRLDLDAVRDEVARSRHSLVGLLRVFQETCADDSGQYIHYGATTQDIQDTAQSLEMRDVIDQLDSELRAIVECLTDMAEQHVDTLAVGRTHARAALPMSFGLKVASWVDELLRHAQRIDAMRERVLVAELFGGVGTMAGFGDRGPELLERFAARVGLHVPLVAWHVARDRVVEYVATLAGVAGTLARIADELRILSRPEFGEVEEGWTYGVVGSSTMPHKRNPERLEQVVVMAKLAASQVGVALSGMTGDHERDSRSLRVEWVCVPDVSHYCLAGCAILRTVLDGLEVHTDRVESNARAVADEIASESLMLLLAERIGKQNAHEHVYRLSQEAYGEGRTLREVIGQDEQTLALLDEEILRRTFQPSSYLGQSVELTASVVARGREWLHGGAASAR